MCYFLRLAVFLVKGLFDFADALGAAFAFRSLAMPTALARTLLDLAFGAAFFTARLVGFLDAGREAFLRAGLAAFLRAGLAAFFLAAFFVLTAATGASFSLAGLGSSRHPCASRTAIIARRMPRSEERRVGKEGRSRWSPHP